MIKTNFKINDLMFYLELSEIGKKIGKALYRLENENGIYGYEVHQLRYKYSEKSQRMYWKIADDSDFGIHAWSYNELLYLAALKKYEEIKIEGN